MAKLDGLQIVLDFLNGLLVEVILVGKRNDDEVYKKLERLF
jgi:hypothetical protein